MGRQIPIKFINGGLDIEGHLHEVAGAGCTNVWHLHVNDYYQGTLRFTDGKWVFQGKRYSDLADFFGKQVDAKPDT